MLAYNDLKKGTLFIWNDEPYEVLEYNFVRMQQRRPSAQTKIKHLKTGSISTQTFKQSDVFNELVIGKKPATLVFCHRGQCTFSLQNKERFTMDEQRLGDKVGYLKPNMEIEARYIEDELLDIGLPIKVELKVVECPPGIKGNTAQGGVKQVTLESGLKINAPLFINEGDVLRINTESGEYVERVGK